METEHSKPAIRSTTVGVGQHNQTTIGPVRLRVNSIHAVGGSRRKVSQVRLRDFRIRERGEAKASPFGPAGKFASTDHNRMLGDFFLVIHSEGSGPIGPIKEIAVLGYDAKAKHDTYVGYNSMGLHETSTGTVSAARATSPDFRLCALRRSRCGRLRRFLRWLTGDVGAELVEQERPGIRAHGGPQVLTRTDAPVARIAEA